MPSTVPLDRSNGYEAAAEAFMAFRTEGSIGVGTVREWASALPRGATVLDLGCGHGLPISQALLDDGFTLYGIDAAPTMIAAFRARFPDAPAECSAVEDSRFFNRKFDGVVAWGLLFLLTRAVQTTVIQKVSAALKPGGEFLFTASRQACEWPDTLTGRPAVSLGVEAYRRLLEAAGLVLAGEADDEGDNHYYFASSLAPRAGAV